MSTGQVVVVGSASVTHLYRMEALPMVGEMVTARPREVRLGGSGANQATAAHRLGVPTLFIGRVGEDDPGREIEADLDASGIDHRLLRTPDVETAVTVTWIDDQGEMMAVGHHGANARLDVSDVEGVAREIETAQVVLAGGTIPPATTRAAFEHVPEDSEAVRMLDLRLVPDATELFECSDVIVTDPLTAERLTEVGIAAVDDALAAVRGLVGMGARDPVLYLGPLGAVCIDRGRTEHVPAPEVEPVDPSGVEDAFKGALAAFLAEEQDLADAVESAVRYAALALAERGAHTAYADRAAWEAAHPRD